VNVVCLQGTCSSVGRSGEMEVGAHSCHAAAAEALLGAVGARALRHCDELAGRGARRAVGRGLTGQEGDYEEGGCEEGTSEHFEQVSGRLRGLRRTSGLLLFWKWSW
jgi:hypothetical protein